jgi:phosphatidylglycerophosphate synthase
MKDKALQPVAGAFRRVPPLALTGVGVVLGLGAAVAGWASAFSLGLVLWVLNRIMDGLDGTVARLEGKESDLGGVLDLVGDFLVYGTIPMALAIRPEAPPELPRAAVALLVAFYVNSAAWMVPAGLLEKRAGKEAPVGGEGNGPTALTIPEGLVSGGETVVFYALFFLFPGHQVSLFLVMAGLTGLTVLQRVVWAFRTFRPGVEPAVSPAVSPSVEPGAEPGVEPAAEPVVEPGVEPAAEPVVEPSPTGEP